jgi:hypothetical protein
MTPSNALSSAENVLATADGFFAIADALHQRLNSSATRVLFAAASTDLYGMLIEEYGLRARAAILRNNAKQHVVDNCTVSQERLYRCLEATAHQVLTIPGAAQLRSVVASVNTLCVGISPGKGHVVDFLVQELEGDLESKPSIHPLHT